MAQDKLIVRGAREHNLQNIDVEIPRDKYVVITGISGSGKSSLAFDTIYAEGQRRYVESLSAYARQFLGQMEKPDVDQIEGLSPAISIDQKGASHNPRSTVGTVTEIYDYLRLLYARIGVPHCPNCGRMIAQQTSEQIVDNVLSLPDDSRIMILAPLIKDRKGHHQRVFEDIRKAGFVRVRVDGELYDVNEQIELDRYKMHTIEVVVDRLIVRPGDNGHGLDRARLADSVETALELGDGTLIVNLVNGAQPPEDILFSEHFACVECGISLPEIEPRSFSFNSPHGACPACQGLGSRMEIDPDLIAPNPDLSIKQGAIAPWSKGKNSEGYYMQLLRGVARQYGFSVDTPWRDLPMRARQVVLYGSGGERITLDYENRYGARRRYETTYEGVIPNLRRRHTETDSDYVRSGIEEYMTTRPCPTCNGARLKPESMAVTVGDRGIVEVTQMSVAEAREWVEQLMGTAPSGADGDGHTRRHEAALSERELMIAGQILKEISARLGFLMDVGLDYLTLDRRASTLAGGEAQRIRLATQIGSQLMGVLYILDEPSIGLHQRDNARLIRTLLNLRDLGNTVLVVEHDEETIRSADWIVDLGPGAGEHGGHVVASGPLDAVMKAPASITGQYLAGKQQIEVPERRRAGSGKVLTLFGAAEHNLKEINVELPLGKFICVTGVSGSGKSTLVIEVLYKRLAQVIYRSKVRPGAHQGIEGVEHLDKVIDIDQSPIGRTPRSNPGTYTNVFTPIRQLFAELPESKVRGYKPGRFSFNVKGGRCEA
ncbi:MAG: excinuclease ABC subunit UvrA, partial [Anaerolineae bacterium]